MHREPIITWSLLIGGIGTILNELKEYRFPAHAAVLVSSLFEIIQLVEARKNYRLTIPISIQVLHFQFLYLQSGNL